VRLLGVDINLRGTSDLVDSLELMVTNAKKLEETILQKAAEPVLAEMQNTAAFIDRTGDLRKSLKISKLRSSRMNWKLGRKFVWVGDVDRKAEYGWYLEFGTSTISARPFIQPALEQHEGEVFETIKQGLKEALGR